MSAPTDPPSSSLVPLKSTARDSVPTIIGQSARNPVTEALALAAGSTLGHFEILAPLGAGGMASVLKARDTHLGRLVALKILPPEAARDGDAVTRFKQEARAAAKLDHENVARVFFSGEDRGLHFIAFEFVEGETLRARIERLGHLPATDAVRFLLHCAAGLQHLSERGVVHRDIKPGNVVVTPDGRAKLIDLGLARHAGSVSVNGGVTQSGVTLGTFDYISPEQARDPRTADVRSDIYSLGCTFYHALTGRPPVPEGTAAVKLSAQQLSAPTDPRELNPDVPDSLAMVLNRMLGKDPARRYQTPADLIRELSDVARQLGVAVERTTTEGSSTSSSTTHPRLPADGPRVPVSWIVAGVVLIAAGLVVASLTGGRTPAGQTALPWDDAPGAKPVSPFDTLGKDDQPRKLVPSTGPRLVASADELIEAARAEVAVIGLQPGTVYDLSDTAGLYFAGRKLTLECADPRNPAVVRVAVSPLADPPAVREGGFTVGKAETVSIRGVRFEFVEKAVPAGEEEPQEPVGVAVMDAGKLDIQECVWDEPDGKDGKVKSAHVATLYVGHSGKAKPTEFAAKHSYFGTRRWTGIAFDGPVTASLSECGFTAGRIAVRVAAGPETVGGEAASTLDIRHCSFLLDHRAAAVLVDSAKTGVTVGFCVFAAPAPPDPAAMMMTETDRKPVALRVVGTDAASVTFAAVPNEPSAYFRCEIPTGAVGADSSELLAAPWRTVPPAADRAEPWKMLELNPAVRAVRVTRPGGTRILGATRLPTAAGRLYDWPPGSVSANSPKPGVKVWYPNPPAAEKGQLPRGVFDDLQKAIDALGANDVLHIRANGPTKVPTAVLSKAARVTTIQPEDGFAPVLVPAADGPLFRVEEGELRLERLHVRLTRPAEAAVTATSAVVLAGGRRCVWTDCTVTADDTVGELSAAVLVTAPAGRPASEVRPEVRFERCLVRGTGRLVRMPAAVPAIVAASHTAIAVTGPVIELGSPGERPAEGAAVRVQLSRVTALLSAPFVETTLTDATETGFVAVQLEAEGSLFAPAEKFAGPILRANGGDPTLAARYFPWVAVAPNRFANFAPRSVFLEVPPKRLESADWLTFSKERRSAFGKVVFATPPAPRGLASVLAADLAVTEGDAADEFGARTGQLPTPPDPPEK